MTTDNEALAKELERQIERSDFAWKNVHAIEKDRQRLNAEIDHLRAENAKLHKLVDALYSGEILGNERRYAAARLNAGRLLRGDPRWDDEPAAHEATP